MPDPQTPGVHRLHDMLVEEVSMVDRAANRRKFLLVKRDSTMPAGAPLQARPDGSFTATGGGGSAPAPNAGAQPAAPAAAPQVKVTISLTAEAKSALSDAIDAAASALDDTAAMVKSAKEVSSDPADGEAMDAGSLMDALSGVIEGLEDAVYAVFGQDEDTDEAPEGQPATPAPGTATPVAAAAPSIGKRLELLKAKRVIAKAEAEVAARGLIAKYGTRMKKERLARFQAALSTLMSVANEIAPPATIDKGKKPPPPPAAPAGGAYPPGKKPPVAKSDAASPTTDVAQHPAFIALQKQAKEMTEQLATLRKQDGTSNALTPNAPAARGANDEVSWPMDLNDNRFGDPKDPNHFGR